MTILSTLSEMSGPVKTLYHYTNGAALIKILEANILKANTYDTGLHTDRKVLPKKEIATVRPSMAHPENLEGLSNEIGSVRIEISINKLNDKIKGITAKPLAEIPLRDINKLSDLLSHHILNRKLSRKEVEKIYSIVAKELLKKDIEEESDLKDLSENQVAKDMFIHIMHVMYPNAKILTSDALYDNLFFDILDAVGSIKYFLRNREGEERITVRGEGIPLNPYYMKINLLKGFWNSIKNYYLVPKKELEEKFNLIKKNRKLFIENDEFNNMFSEMYERVKHGSP